MQANTRAGIEGTKIKTIMFQELKTEVWQKGMDEKRIST